MDRINRQLNLVFDKICFCWRLIKHYFSILLVVFYCHDGFQGDDLGRDGPVKLTLPLCLKYVGLHHDSHLLQSGDSLCHSHCVQK